jgi:hypothetical protein
MIEQKSIDHQLRQAGPDVEVERAPVGRIRGQAALGQQPGQDRGQEKKRWEDGR